MAEFVKELIIVKQSIVKNEVGENVVIEDAFLQDLDSRYIIVKDAIDYEIFNTGEVAIYLFNKLILRPGSSYSPQKSHAFKFGKDIEYTFESDFARNLQQAVNTDPEPVPGG